ncbi:MAG: hypothetical protein WKF70_01245, partial [Chitinophagaceae bacterium]
MKQFVNYFLLIAAAAVLFAACDKVDALPRYEAGKAVTVAASSAAIAPPAADSNKVALTLSWSSPGYATDSANIKYTIEIDS